MSYDAAYPELAMRPDLPMAMRRDLPMARGDKALQEAARLEGVALLPC